MGARLTLDARGQLAAENDEARNALAEKAGHYELQPTAPDWLCLLRSPAEGGKRGKPRVALAGDASAFPLPDLIAFLGLSRWSGAIRTSDPTGNRAIYLKDGEVRGASSDVPDDRLGEVLVRMGHVQRAQLNEVLRELPPSKVGRVLVERGLLQAHDLYKCVTHQVSDIFHAIVVAREGMFLLVDQELEERQGGGLALSTQSLLMDSIRKIDEMAHFRERIPHGRMYVTRKRDDDGKLEADEQEMLACVDGRRTVLEISQRTKLGEFDATKVIFRLLEGGYVGVSERPQTLEMPAVVAPASPSAQGPAARTVDVGPVVHVFNFIFREVMGEVQAQCDPRPFLDAANAALDGQALSSSPVLRGLAFQADGALPEEQLLRAYEAHRALLGPEPAVALRGALSDLTFFLLFQAGELIEPAAEEDLARRVKELLATLGGS